MSDIEINDLSEHTRISNEEMAKSSGGYSFYIKIDGHKPKPTWSWNLSDISLLKLGGLSTTLK